MVTVEIKPWVSVPIDLDKYREGNYASRNQNNSKGLICDCELCQKLIALRDQVLGNQAGFKRIVQNNQAQVRKEKLSLVVEAPGFYEFKTVSKKTEGRFSGFFFSEAGKFSLVSLYKTARSKLDEENLLLDDELKALFEGETPNGFTVAFSSILPVGKLEGDYWNQIKDLINAANAGEEIELEEKPSEEIDFSNIFMLNERYIPFFATSFDYIFQLTEDGRKKKAIKKIPGMPTKNDVGALSYVKNLVRRLFDAAVDLYDTSVLYSFAYDTVEHRFVTSLEISDFVWRTINNNPDNFKKSQVDLVKQAKSPMEFYKELVIDFAKNGANDFGIRELIPVNTSATFSTRNWEVGRNQYEKVQKSGYYTVVTYKDKVGIGSGGKWGGYVYSRFDEEMGRAKLIHSAWCQRVSSWSKKELGEVDQLYDIWPFVDWITGPFAEDKGIKISGAPLLFSGNNVKTKRNALADLRARMDRKR